MLHKYNSIMASVFLFVFPCLSSADELILKNGNLIYGDLRKVNSGYALFDVGCAGDTKKIRWNKIDSITLSESKANCQSIKLPAVGGPDECFDQDNPKYLEASPIWELTLYENHATFFAYASKISIGAKTVTWFDPVLEKQFSFKRLGMTIAKTDKACLSEYPTN